MVKSEHLSAPVLPVEVAAGDLVRIALLDIWGRFPYSFSSFCFWLYNLWGAKP
jgi:hypothetical protein